MMLAANGSAWQSSAAMPTCSCSSHPVVRSGRRGGRGHAGWDAAAVYTHRTAVVRAARWRSHGRRHGVINLFPRTTCWRDAPHAPRSHGAGLEQHNSAAVWNPVACVLPLTLFFRQGALVLAQEHVTIAHDGHRIAHMELPDLINRHNWTDMRGLCVLFRQQGPSSACVDDG